MDYIKIRSSSPAGDLIAMLAGVKQICKDKNVKAIIYQRINVVSVGYMGAQHPYTNDNGDSINMNFDTFQKLKPFIEVQDYVESFLLYEGQPFEMDFDKCRMEIYTGQPLGSLARYLFHVFPETSTDLSRRWMDVPEYDTYGNCYTKSNCHTKIGYSGKAIINFTFRYRNYLIDYSFLKNHEKDLVFAGLPNEYKTFCQQWGLSMPFLCDKDFLEFALILKHCKFFVGNASSNFWIAEAMKIPRMLEIFPVVPNTIPEGENAYDYFHNAEAKYYFNKLLNL